MSSPLPSRPRPNSDQMSVASSSTSTRSPAFFSLKRKASDTTLASSSTGAPALRVRDREDPFVDPPRGPRADMVVEPEPIRGQLTDNPHIFIPESNIWFRQGNLHRMKTMIENGKS